jgi:hypothetical protein
MNARHPIRGLANTGLVIACLFQGPKEQTTVLGRHFQLSSRIDAEKFHDRPIDDDPIAVSDPSQHLDHHLPPSFSISVATMLLRTLA